MRDLNLLPKILAVLLLSAASLAKAHAAELAVPSGYATIQDAVDAAQDGDTIVLSAAR